ncbi:unnamed protein product [Closterium sp. NIES-54]
MASPRVLRFDAEGRMLEFSIWLLRAQRLLECQVQADESMWAHASGDLRAPPDPEPLGADPTTKDRYRFACQRATLTAWKSRDAAACIALSSLLPEFEETHFTQVRTASESGRRGGQGASGSRGGVGGVAGDGDGSAGVGGAPGAVSSDSPTAAGGGDARVRRAPAGLPAAGAGVAAWYLTQRQQPLLSQRPHQQQGQQQGSGPCQLSHGGDIHPPCPYLVQTGTRSGLRCDRRHPPGQGFSQLTNTLCVAYGVDGPAPYWFPFACSHSAALWAMSASQLLDLLGTDHAMYAVVDSIASDSVYSRVFSLGASVDPMPVASVGACLGTSPGAAQEDASLSFTLDSGASHCFFRDHMNLTPLPTLVFVALADPTSGPDTALYTTTLPCPAVPSGFLMGFHVPSFSKNLVGVRPLVGSHVGFWFEPSGDSATCVNGDTYVPLATFHAEPGSGLYTLHTAPQERKQQQQHQRQLPPTPITAPRQVPTSHQVPASHRVAVPSQVPAYGPVVASCSCWSLAHPTFLWHHRLGHPSIPRLRTISSQRLVLGLPRVPSPSPLSSSQPIADPTGAGVGVEDPGGASSRGDSSLQGGGVSLAVPGGATTGGEGAPSAGAGEPRADCVASGGASSGGGATGALEGGPGATTAQDPTPPPHRYLIRHRDRLRHAPTAARGAAVAAAATAAGPAAAAAAEGGAAATVAGAAPAATSASCLWPLDPQSPLSVSSLLPPSSCLRSHSALTASLSTPVTDYYHTYRPVLSRVLASLVTHPRASLSSVSALTAVVTEFATTRRLDYATRVVAAPPTSPLAAGQVLQWFGLQHSIVQRTPLVVDHRLTGPFPDEPFESSGPYAELLGCLMYMMTCTRPNLAFPLSILARFVLPRRHCPVHWTAAVRVAKYLATISGVGLVLGGRQSVVFTGHSDSSYTDDVEIHRSTQGYCFSVGSGAVLWRSTRSSSVSTSTTEAEIYAGAMSAQELRWLTKALRRGQARLDFVESEANTADIFTKALPPCDHHRCCVQLGLVDTDSHLV